MSNMNDTFNFLDEEKEEKTPVLDLEKLKSFREAKDLTKDRYATKSEAKIKKTRVEQRSYIDKQKKKGKKPINVFIENQNLNNLDIIIDQYAREFSRNYNRSDLLNLILKDFFKTYQQASDFEYERERDE